MKAISLLVALWLAAGTGLAQVAADVEALRADGPFTHLNLSIYILFRKQMPPNPPAYITLKEGLAGGQVRISELPSAAVGQLLVSNLSDRRLFLQAGELLHGGRQDRTLQTSLVIPPRTGDVPIPSLCIERARWSGGKEFAADGQIAPRSIQNSIASGSQDRVWDSVGKYKAEARSAMGPSAGASRSSSLNEELRSDAFKRVMGGYESALSGAINRYANPIGMVWAINGRIEQAEVYHTSDLFRRLFPALLSAAAAEAGAKLGVPVPVPLPEPIPVPLPGPRGERDIMPRPRPIPRPPPTHNPPALKEVSDFLVAVWDGAKSEERLTAGNVRVRVTSTAGTKDDLMFNGEWIHSHILPREAGIIIPVPRPPIHPMPRE